MLDAQENELVTRVGPGTPLGALFREYWWPVLRAESLEADGAPRRVRLLGENFVAFRATDGRLGFFDEGCPHRGASLAIGRNEDCALRCLLHGWKVDVSGSVVETPNQVTGHAERIAVAHYPVVERGGLVWVWIGAGEAPEFPTLSFASLDPEVGVRTMAAVVNCNYLQLMETLWDPAHQAILHSQDSGLADVFAEAGAEASYAQERPPTAVIGGESVAEPYGFRYRFDQWSVLAANTWIATVMPMWVFIGPLGPTQESDRAVFGHVPIDDEHTLLLQLGYNPAQPLGPVGRILTTADDPDNFREPGMGPENAWGQDREAMRNGSFTGIGLGGGNPGILAQDIATLESMGSIQDRTKERLGPADYAVIKGRRMLIDAIRAHQRGEGALGVDEDVSDVGVPNGRECQPPGDALVTA